MSSLLLHQSCAITEWGFHSGMQFAHNDNDEFLLELFLSTMQQRRRLWTAVPSYIKTIRAAHEHHTTMVIDQDRLGLSSWSMENIRTQNTEISDSQWMHALHIRFWKNDMFLFKVSVTYIMEYAAMEGFYYIGVLGWYTRTRTIQECFTLFDSIEHEKENLLMAHHTMETCMDAMHYLSQEIRREHDPIRLASMESKMEYMKQAYASVQRVVLPMHLCSLNIL
jgi:hypothetical protein